MKNKFFGDIRDYRKYGLLRILSGGKRASAAICWMLTPDGRLATKTDYLFRDKTWHHNTCWHFDERLFDALHRAVIVDRERIVVRAEHPDILDPSVFCFHKELLRDAVNKRRECFHRFLDSCEGRDLIFFDPDNGLEVKSVPAGRKGSSRYLYYDELARAFNRGHSILVFQFFMMKVPEDVINERTDQIFDRLDVDRIACFKTPAVVFFLIPQPKHLDEMKQRSEQIGRVWGKQLEPVWRSRTGTNRGTKTGRRERARRR